MIGMGRWKSVEASVLYRSEPKSKSAKFQMWEAEHGGVGGIALLSSKVDK